MSVMGWVWLGVALWLAASVSLGFVVGRIIRRRDAQVPMRHSPVQRTSPEPDRDVAAS